MKLIIWNHHNMITEIYIILLYKTCPCFSGRLKFGEGHILNARSPGPFRGSSNNSTFVETLVAFWLPAPLWTASPEHRKSKSSCKRLVLQNSTPNTSMWLLTTTNIDRLVKTVDKHQPKWSNVWNTQTGWWFQPIRKILVKSENLP